MLGARRQHFLLKPEAVEKLFEKIGPRFNQRNGGYTASSSSAGARATERKRPSSNWSVPNWSSAQQSGLPGERND
jgi:hypothetical protein